MLLELIVVLPLLGLIGVMLSGVFLTHASIARHARERARVSETVRLTAGVLRAELRWLDPDRDLHAWMGDSVRLRSFRGLAVPCRHRADQLMVAYSGLRQADPAKDSVLVIGASPERVHALRAATDTTASCRRGQRTQFFRLDPPTAAEGILLVFETGSYSLHDAALRYRVGASGRQPITDELIDVNKSRFDTLSFNLTLALAPRSVGSYHLRFRMLNQSNQ